MSGGLSIWVIYDHPTDYPDDYIARCWIGLDATPSIIVSKDIEMIRHQMFDMGLTKLDRMSNDDPKIVETWL